ncbi:MAG TPA: hypothetical protein PLP23_04915 [Panacibacter sp.]|nr:hypothetical protein [Panacibacter sp.]
MTLEDFKNWTDIISSTLTSLSIIIGGSWVVYRFILQQERYPNINFSTDINVIGIQDGHWIVELIALVENKGKAQHRMKDFGFSLNVMFANDKVETKEKWGGQVDFPTKLAGGSYLPKHLTYFFIDPGTIAKYSFITKIPENASFAILHSNFAYDNRKGYMHTAERTINLTKISTKLSAL